MELNEIQVGALASLVTEALKLIPWLRKNEITVALTAIIINTVGTYVFVGTSIYSIGTVFLYSLASYHVLIKPVAKSLGLKSQ